MKFENVNQLLRHFLAGGERKNLAEKETETTGDATTEVEVGTVGRRETIVSVMGGAEVAAIIRI